MGLLSIELSRERIREREYEVGEMHVIALARAADRRTDRDGRAWPFHVRRILLIR